MNFKITPPIFHSGAWDGSAGAACGEGYFIGATDEMNTLRLYPIVAGAEGTPMLDLNAWPLFPKKADKADGFKEADIEGAAVMGEMVYWIASHARDSTGKAREERQVFFATTMHGLGAAAKLEPCGKPYLRLLDDMLADPQLDFLHEPIAKKIAPKELGGFNIEALCADGERLWIGFRNPIIAGRAVLVPLTNPMAMIQAGARAIFGDPVFLELGGLGFRDMVRWRDGFLIVAGDYRDRFENAQALPPKLLLWSGKGFETPVDLRVDLLDLNPEAAIVFGDEKDGRLLILSDDGKWHAQPGEDRKHTGDAKRQFRSAWLVGE